MENTKNYRSTVIIIILSTTVVLLLGIVIFEKALNSETNVSDNNNINENNNNNNNDNNDDNESQLQNNYSSFKTLYSNNGDTLTLGIYEKDNSTIIELISDKNITLFENKINTPTTPLNVDLLDVKIHRVTSEHIAVEYLSPVIVENDEAFEVVNYSHEYLLFNVLDNKYEEITNIGSGLAAVASKTLGENIGNYQIKDGKILFYYTRYKNFESFNNKITLDKTKGFHYLELTPAGNNFNLKELTPPYNDLEVAGTEY